MFIDVKANACWMQREKISWKKQKLSKKNQREELKNMVSEIKKIKITG